MPIIEPARKSSVAMMEMTHAAKTRNQLMPFRPRALKSHPLAEVLGVTGRFLFGIGLVVAQADIAINSWASAPAL